MTHTKLYAEEQIINQETVNIQEILNREEFKQPIPTEFIKLKVEEGNYMGSTKWKDKPNYERYGFCLEDNEEKWVQIDIPHKLMEILEMPIGEDINYPLYLSPNVLKNEKKQPTRGAYTIENKEEIFIDKPVSEKNVEKELVKRLKELEKEREENRKLQEINKKSCLLSLFRKKNINKLSHRLFKAEGKIYKLETELKKWTNQFQNQTPKEVQEKINTLTAERDSRPTQQQLNNLQKELNKEQSWWDKWDNDFHAKDFKLNFSADPDSPNIMLTLEWGRVHFFLLLLNSKHCHYFENKPGYIKEAFWLKEEKKEEVYRDFRLEIKKVYEYYKNK